MKVWLKEWDYAYDNEHNVSVWASELAALQSCVSEIQDSITNNWDMDDETQAQYSDEFTELLLKREYRLAMEKWNDYQSNHNDEQCEYWFVSSKDILGGDDQEIVTSASAVAFKASSSGATCRGPCGQYNDYAYADKSDGTHLCRQCSTFKHIFGVNP
jgi:hypothetical protein